MLHSPSSSPLISLCLSIGLAKCNKLCSLRAAKYLTGVTNMLHFTHTLTALLWDVACTGHRPGTRHATQLKLSNNIACHSLAVVLLPKGDLPANCACYCSSPGPRQLSRAAERRPCRELMTPGAASAATCAHKQASESEHSEEDVITRSRLSSAPLHPAHDMLRPAPHVNSCACRCSLDQERWRNDSTPDLTVLMHAVIT